MIPTIQLDRHSVSSMLPSLRPLIRVASMAMALVMPPAIAADGAVKIPDFTKGDDIPAKAPHDWNLGPTGLRGWMFCDRLVTTDARQIAITSVEAESPADGVLAVGDVLLGAAGRPFSTDPRAELGRAITAAETEAGGGRLVLTRWRDGT